MKRILLLGSKEYPLGTNKGEDPITSGGYERYLEDLVDELATRDVASIIITRKFKDVPTYERRKKREIYRVPWVSGFYLRNISFNFFAFLKARKLSYDAIIATGMFATFFGSLLKRDVRLISRPGGIASKQPQYPWVLKKILRAAEKIIYRRADVVVFLSSEEEKNFKEALGFSPKKSILIPTAVNLDRFVVSKREQMQLKKEWNIKDELVVTFVGRLNKVKGTDFLIRAITSLTNKKIRCFIIGDGPEKETLTKLAGTDERIIFTGHRTDIPAFLSITDIFVLPSLSEGLPIALLEAMVSGCACVVTDIGLPVKNGKNALVVPPSNANELKRAIEHLIDDSSIRYNMGRTNKTEIKKTRSWKKVADSYLSVV